MLAQAIAPRRRSRVVYPAESEIQRLEAEVESSPWDPYPRCNLACVLAETGAHSRAMTQLAIAMELPAGAIAAGCVSSAIRQVADEFAAAWQLPTSSPHRLLASA